MNNKNKSIKSQFFLSFSIFIILIALVFTVTANYFIFLSFHKSAELERTTIVNEIILNIEEASEDNIDYEKLRNIGKRALKFGMTVTIINSSSEILYCIVADSGETKAELLSNFDQYFPTLFTDSPPEIMTRNIPINNEQTLVISFYKPLYYNDIQRSLIKEINSLVVFLSLIFIVISFISSKFISKKFFNPITEITQQAKDMINSHDLQSISQQSDITEIQDLIHSFNKLSIGLFDEKVKRKRLLSSYAHEVRTPLQAISANIEGMSDGIIEPSHKNMVVLYNELLRLTKLVENIEQIFDIDENHLRKTNIDIFKLIKQAILIYETDIKKRHIKIDFKSDNIFAFGDEDKIYRVILNLISNAIKYTDTGGEIYINVTQDFGKTTLSIINQGIPLDEKEVEFIFDYLYRSKDVEKYVSGLGIGLAIVKAIITAHGGKVSAKPIANYGNEITIIF